MTTRASTWLVRRKWILAAVGLPVLVALWWAFRPEKLWINEKVNEAAPFDTSGGPQPILTGRFEDKAQQTSGRATIYKKPGGEEYLRLSDFTTANDRGCSRRACAKRWNGATSIASILGL